MALAAVANNFEQDSPGVDIMPPMIFYTCLAFGAVLNFFMPHDFALLSRPLRILLGLGLGGAGFTLMMMAHEKFKRIGTNVPTNLPATTLVVHGVYRFSRNPMYVGGSAFFLGIGLVAGSFWMMASYLPLGLYLSFYVIPREEAYMNRKYGDAYRTYSRQVRRWL